MAIVMVGGVYCPLSPRDPQHRLHALLQQTQTGLVLVHWMTANKFNHDIISLDVDTVFIEKGIERDVDVDRLSRLLITPNNVAYIIFTSGSTGMPKAVS